MPQRFSRFFLGDKRSGTQISGTMTVSFLNKKSPAGLFPK
jgi:hypothetical protein